jgi:hypothetical protein
MNVTEAQRFDLMYLLRNIITEVHKAKAALHHWPDELSHIDSLAHGAIDILSAAQKSKDVA